MVDVGEKAVTRREATAFASVGLSPAAFQLLLDRALPKGDVLTTARLAGIMAAKQTSSLIPLTHPLTLSHIEIEIVPVTTENTLEIRATVRCEGKTGVEIEAMTAFSAAAPAAARPGVALLVSRLRARQEAGNATLAAALEEAREHDLRARLHALAEMAG